MSTDLDRRLREYITAEYKPAYQPPICHEAADEIDRLRAEVERLRADAEMFDFLEQQHALGRDPWDWELLDQAGNWRAAISTSMRDVGEISRRDYTTEVETLRQRAEAAEAKLEQLRTNALVIWKPRAEAKMLAFYEPLAELGEPGLAWLIGNLGALVDSANAKLVEAQQREAWWGEYAKLNYMRASVGGLDKLPTADLKQWRELLRLLGLDAAQGGEK